MTALQRKPKPRVGQIIASHPLTNTPELQHLVILLVEVTPDHSLGIILNRPSKDTVKDALEDFPEVDTPLYYGGPTQQADVDFIHRIDEVGGDEIFPGMYRSGDFEELVFRLEIGQIHEEDALFFAGFVIWQDDLLNDELSYNGWIIGNMTESLRDKIFSKDGSVDLWEEALRSMGRYTIFTNFPGIPSVN